MGHGLYGQQALTGRYGGAAGQDAYGYQAQPQGYRGYGGSQYGQFYGQNQ